MDIDNSRLPFGNRFVLLKASHRISHGLRTPYSSPPYDHRSV
ncbi:hypothetical protein NY08_4582 [Rhodococcus sp. B7740]|nr:hypothetical protein NY08_4582 [Rhodococcus sp. B7740]